MPQIAIVDPDVCNPEKCGLECINSCPVNRQGKDCIFLNEGGDLARIDESLCIGCGICPKKCPLDAINIINLKEEKGELIHQYGKNSFRLYNLPVPREGRVVGLLGKNGIGKSTALKILAGEIKPNLGEYECEMEWGEIIKKFRGTELQNYLEKMKDEDIKVSYKPQRVNKIKKHYSGKVSEFLDEKVEGLELDKIWDKKLEDLSGGELQRLAIAAAILKESDITLFDEPSSYLDVRQRLLVAQKIREIAQERKVVVIEHDLASLDYLSDEIHILFGAPGAYGVISTPLTERSGINQFLEGFLKQENVRIRKEAINFPERTKQVRKKEKLIEISEIEKELGGFNLKTESGELRKGEILGIFGRNALGKTTLAKIIAGKIEPDKGEIERLSLSYKPQYISPDFSGTVRDLLSEEADVYSQEYKARIINPFDLEDLLDREVGELSSGELQRAAVALCLSRDAEVFLLDEPTAFLDVEKRVEFAKNLRKFMEREEKTGIIIDHDLLLLDFIADRAMVFDGEPGKKGIARSPQPLREGINAFLKDVEVTFRRDPTTGRPRANKKGSRKDKEQKEKGEYYCP